MDWNKLKKFKNQMHLVRDALKAMSEKEFSLSFEFEKDKGIRSVPKFPPKQEIARFATVMKPLADDESDLNFKIIFKILVENSVISAAENEELKNKIDSLESGPIRFQIAPECELTRRDFYYFYSRGEFFDEREFEKAKLEDLRKLPLVPHFILNEFYSYCLDVYRLCEYLYFLVRSAEKKATATNSKDHAFNQCIYCLTTTGTFESEEHVYPESLGNREIVLPPGYVCDDCNNNVLSRLDEELVNHDIIAFLRAYVLPYNPKSGKFLKARYQNLHVEKIGPTEIVITHHNPKEGFFMEEHKGQFKGKLFMRGRKKFNPKLLGRCLYKIGLGIICAQNGIETALDSKYNPARAFILGKQAFPNNLFICRKGVPEARIEGIHRFFFPGTIFKISIFGISFFFNLECEPLLKTDHDLVRTHLQSYSLAD